MARPPFVEGIDWPEAGRITASDPPTFSVATDLHPLYFSIQSTIPQLDHPEEDVQPASCRVKRNEAQNSGAAR